MNTNLRATMAERARAAEQAPVDLGPVLRAGDRRRRIRAMSVSGVAAVAVAALAFGGSALIGSDTQPVVSAGPNVASYANGSTIHVGHETVDVGDHTIHAYVRTSNGFVFSDAADDVYFTDGASVQQIGSGVVREGNLRAEGPYVAWVDNGPDVPEFVAYDTESMKEVLRTAEGNDVDHGPNFETNPASAVALDGTNLYAMNGRGFARIDLTTGRTEQLRTGGVSVYDIVDVENGQIAHDALDTQREDLVVGPDLSSKGASVPLHTFIGDSPMGLSPDATHITTGREITDGQWTTDVTDVQTGQVTRFSMPGYTWSYRPVWLDNDTLSLVAGRRNTDGPEKAAELLTCKLSTGDCTTTASLGAYGEYQLPDGQFESDAGL